MLTRAAHPQRCVEVYHLQRTRFASITERKLRWRQLTEDGNAVRKLARSIYAWKVLLNLVNLKTKSAGDGYLKKALEKTVLRFLGSRTFPPLHPKRSSGCATALGAI